MAMDVLIVDDSAAIRKILQRDLLQTNLALGKIHEAHDGKEALEANAQRECWADPIGYQHAEHGWTGVFKGGEGKPGLEERPCDDGHQRG